MRKSQHPEKLVGDLMQWRAFCHGSHVDRKIYLLDNLLYMIYIPSYFVVLICLGWNRRLISYLHL